MRMLTTPAERGYLSLAARRMYQYAKEASERGETYHPIGGLTPLSCGVSVRLTYSDAAGGPEALITARAPKDYPREKIEQIGTEILQRPMRINHSEDAPAGLVAYTLSVCPPNQSST